jgi:hypothetical protein
VKQEVYFALFTESENAFRRMNNVFAIREAEKRQRKAVEKALEEARLRRLPLRLDDGSDNVFHVLLIRVSAGALDDDSVRGALKTVRDTVADWIGLDDRHVNLRFAYPQQRGPKGFHGVRIIIHDKSMGPDVVRVLGTPSPPTLLEEPEESPSWGRPGCAPKEAPRKGSRSRSSAKQAALPLIRCFAVYPWDQKPGEDAVITEITKLDGASPPAFIDARPPRRPGAPSREIKMQGRRVRLPDPFGECFLYEALPDPQTRTTTTRTPCG